MGRKVAAGISLWLALALGAAATGCRKPLPPAGPQALFRAGGALTERALGIYAEETRIGSLNTGRQEGTWGKSLPVIHLTETVNMSLSFRGDTFDVDSEQHSYLTGDGQLMGSVSSIGFGGGRWEVTVMKREDGSYRKLESYGGPTRESTVRVPSGAVTAESLPLLMAAFNGEGGDSRAYRLFNFTLDREMPLRITFLGRSEGGRRFAVSQWGMEEVITIGSDGLVAAETMTMGVAARNPQPGEETGSLPLERVLTTTSVPASGVPDDIAGRGSAVYRISGSFTPPPGSVWQKVDKDGPESVLHLKRPVPPPLEDRRLLPSDIDTMGLDLDSPRIRELAARITEGLEDPWEKAAAVSEWVYRNLGKSMRECFTAGAALAAREGECQTHSLLTVSLIKAAGVPARFAYGVVYLPGDRGSFFFHTWVEAGVGRWTPLDPTLGSFPAGVDHITLATGSYRDQFRLIPYILGRPGWSVRFVPDQEPVGEPTQALRGTPHQGSADAAISEE